MASSCDIYKEQDRLSRERLYTTVFSQCFSPCGKFLAACSNFGKISIFSLVAALSPDANEDSWNSVFTFKAHKGPVYSLVSTDRWLISAGTGSINAWCWSEILAKTPRVVWSLDIPDVDRFANPETNSLALDTQDGCVRLFAGCGDNKVHVWDITSGSHLLSLEGHTDYVHCVALRSGGQQCLSASEDGTVRIWDTKAGRSALHVIDPSKNAECVRPQLGKWIGCVAVDKADDWMVCGGGPSLCLWHLRSLAATTVFETPKSTINFAMFHEDSIISAGSEPLVQHWLLNGDKRAQVPCSSSNVFNIAVNTRSDNNRVLSIAGNCHQVDICTNFGYKAFSMAFC